MGAGKYRNIGKVYIYCFSITAIVASVMSVFGYFFRNELVWLFSDSPEVIEIGAQRLALVIPFYVFCSLQDVTASQVRGLGKSIEPMLLSLFSVCGLRLLWIFAILPEGHTLIDIYWAYPISWFAAFAMLLIFFIILQIRLLKKEKTKGAAL